MFPLGTGPAPRSTRMPGFYGTGKTMRTIRPGSFWRRKFSSAPRGGQRSRVKLLFPARQLAHLGDHHGRRRINPLEHGEDVLAGDRIDVDAELFRLGHGFSVLKHGEIGAA